MNCELELCIYNECKACTLSGISIDGAGGCADCILVTLEKELLNKYKKRLLDKLLEQDNKL